MFCPHLYCRNLGLPHVVGVSRAVIYMSLAGPNSIYRELETCPAKLVIWIQPLHYGIAWCNFETVMHISQAIHPLQVPQKVWAPFQNELSPKKQDLWNLAIHIPYIYIFIFIAVETIACLVFGRNLDFNMLSFAVAMLPMYRWSTRICIGVSLSRKRISCG